MTIVKLGLENLLSDYLNLLKGKRIGLITGPTGLNRMLKTNITLLLDANVKITALFSGEHGIRGEFQAGEKIDPDTDKITGIPVYSLYGSHRKPTPCMLKNVDILIFDMQDVGSRYYTFVATMAFAQQAASASEKEFFVLDRPNPLGGIKTEGNLVKPGFTSFVGAYPIPMRYGLTIGELSLYLAKNFGIGKNPRIIPLKNWDRTTFFQKTALPWVPPSPNMPTLETAFCYPGLCLFEGTNLSEGRGTTTPFTTIGAPWFDSFSLADTLNSLELPGAIFRPISFIPSFSKHKAIKCLGVQIHVTDNTTFLPVKTALYILEKALEYPETKFLKTSGGYFFDLLAGDDQLRKDLLSKMPIHEIYAKMEEQSRDFSLKAKKYHLY